MIRRILVWDAPTRVFHWLQALSFGAAYLTAFSERLRNYHVALGYILLGLIAFRLLWGFIGTRYARFSSFLFLSLIHISEPTRLGMISYAVFCLKKKKKKNIKTKQ